VEEEYGDIQIGGFKLDYENPNKKIIDSIDQIDIFALFNDKWTVVKKVAVKDGVVYLIKKDGTSVGFTRSTAPAVEPLSDYKQQIKAHNTKIHDNMTHYRSHSK